MADTVQFSLTGIDSFVAKLEAVSFDVKRKGGRAALRKAAQVVADKAKEGAQKLDDAVQSIG
jgi:HK97 gp10 family phage protein